MNDELRAILATQLRWAERRGLEVDEAGHLPSLRDNLFEPLAPEVRDALSRSAARPLGDGVKPGDLQRLDSTAALVCNVLAARDCPLDTVAAALGARRPGATHLRLAQAIPAPAAGLESVEIDAWLESADERPTAVVAHFTESHAVGQAVGPAGLRASARLCGAWLEASEPWRPLPACRGLALDLRHNPKRWRHLPVEALLARASALSAALGPRAFRLRYLWLDVPGPRSGTSRAIRGEIDRFRARVGGEVDFAAISWQQLHASLAETSRAATGQEGSPWLAFLAERYLAL